MTTNYTFLSALYSAVLGFGVSFAVLYLMHLIRTYFYNSVYYDDHCARILGACRRVEATRMGYSTTHVDGVITRKDTYAYTFGGKKYRYTCSGTKDHGEKLTLYFLSNPTTACQEEEIFPKPRSWSHWLIPLGVFISLVLYQYISHYMAITAV